MTRRSRYGRIPRHIGFIPDGNRRWARARGMDPAAGYAMGIDPGLQLLRECRSLGIEEVSIYGFTKENVKRPAAQVAAFRFACADFAARAAADGAALLCVGDLASDLVPPELRDFSVRSSGDLRVNLLVNYNWQWDLSVALAAEIPRAKHDVHRMLGSSEASRIDLIVRWGGRSRISGFLPLQGAYADVHVIDTLWPDTTLADLDGALEWYQHQDVTMGG